MYPFLMTVHVGACVLLVLVVLLQPSKGGGLAIFGGGGDTLFNTPSGTSFMKKMTAGLAFTFAMTSMLLTLMASRPGTKSVTRSRAFPAAPAAVEEEEPAAAEDTGAPAEKAEKPAVPAE